MLTKEENELLTHVGPGTPGGELLRRYWLPVAVARELTDEQPTKFVRILSEDLILFKDKSGNVGLIQDHCAHRGASLLYGRVEERGIACAYHGWLYDAAGSCLECPAEPAGSMFHLTVRMQAYPVQKHVGLYWAYMGPQPAPVITPYDVWARRDGCHTITVQPQLDCNWVAAMENSVDPAHNQILHQRLTYPQFLADGEEEPRVPPSTTRGFIDDIESFDWYPLPYGGIMKKRVFKNGMVDEHPILFPNILRHGTATQIRVPIDDTHTWIVFVGFQPSPDGSIVDEDQDEIRVRYVASYKTPAVALHPHTRFDMNAGQQQDHMAWETQGPIADRTVERLATSDRGVVMYREMLRDEILKVQAGDDPLGLVRDPSHPIIDTNLQQELAGPRVLRPEPPNRRYVER
ncbi:MAG: 5,5-dehydrodivanillate O-demethylase oxygenase subunit [Chloroflexota bacterium]|jgi:5,5'-dehydrodivanillate O-demethylase|nr:5,5-dehydrodivanillate O-demethylase oxygenase subunit [Chloroflexota bacterium]